MVNIREKVREFIYDPVKLNEELRQGSYKKENYEAVGDNLVEMVHTGGGEGYMMFYFGVEGPSEEQIVEEIIGELETIVEDNTQIRIVPIDSSVSLSGNIKGLKDIREYEINATLNIESEETGFYKSASNTLVCKKGEKRDLINTIQECSEYSFIGNSLFIES